MSSRSWQASRWAGGSSTGRPKSIKSSAPRVVGQTTFLFAGSIGRGTILSMVVSLDERKKHIRVGQYLKDTVYAANDGIVTTFAIIAGIAGADLSSRIVLIIGTASLITDGLSMAVGNYLGTKSENDLYKKEEEIERDEIQAVPDREKQEVMEIYTSAGYPEQQARQLTELTVVHEPYWIELMMNKELGLFRNEDHPINNALATFVSFVIAGSIPLIPYFLGYRVSFIASGILAGGTLFVVGSLRRRFSNRSWFVLGLEMLVIGGLAAAVAYFIGAFIHGLLPQAIENP